MFTNWLTGTSGLTNTASSSSSAVPNSTHTRLTADCNNHLAATSSNPASLTLLNSHNLSSLNSNIMSSPPDIVLEVGPAPSAVRFMAHGLVLGMHSGYLRSAIRLDERGAGATNVVAAGVGGGGSNVSDIIVYLTNVTAEQFAPLLTYMYTGYLDLNVENIFGVLLATHVLHMPRALEICRSYLARAQTEGYFGPNNSALSNTNSHQTALAPPPQPATAASGKIIRPIASKPPLTNFGFLPISHQPLALNPLTPPTTTTTTTSGLNASTTVQDTNKTATPEEHMQKPDEEDDIEVDEVDKQSLNNENQIPLHEEDDEDIEVFIDSNSEAEVVVETQIHKLSFKKLMESKKFHQEKETKTKHHEKTHHRKSSHHHSKSERRRKGSSGLQVAKAPIPASQLDTSEANKVIIDVASCDGPVRFKRILNTAYGHKPEACNSSSQHAGGLAGPSIPERSLQSVSLSFHQQMAKTISQQQQLQQAEESENSETSNGSLGAPVRATADKATSGSRKIQSEVFVCVYCKHTFKSQYCYQKHAKRHLNPLTLQATCVPEGKGVNKEESSANGELQITKHQNVTVARPFYVRNPAHYHHATPSTAASSLANGPNALQSSSASSSDYLRREVRPLDMNVQYYPCKTCGCKFPSYYFVHKHRKMCHAEEEAQQSSSDNSATTGASTAIAANATAAGGGGVVNSDECLNSQSSD